MNDIEYRAWDKARNKIFDVTLINFQDKLVNMTYDNKSDWEETKEIIKDYNVPFSRVKLINCFGIKDKKEKEMFEGDIVKWIYPNDDNYHKEKSVFGSIFGVIHWNDKDCSFYIEQISNGSFKFDKNDILSGGNLYFYNYDGKEFDWNDLEVVGNIYENREFYENELEKYKLGIKEE